MKGIVLAGGTGTRLHPITKAISKQTVPIYDKPMIYYPLSVLMLADIKEILIISTPRDIEAFRTLLEDGKQIGVSISYTIQDQPLGIAEAFIIAQQFIGHDTVALVLGDNIFYGYELDVILQEASQRKSGATIFGCRVEHPEDFGVVEFDAKFNVISIEEKPKVPKSHFAVPGLYFYDNEVVEIAKNIKPSPRGELEITSVNNEYLRRGKLKVELFPKQVEWMDTGTYKALLKASNFVEKVQTTQGIYIGCLEEVAYKKGYITKEQLQELAGTLLSTEYGTHLMQLVMGDNNGKF